MAQIKPVCDIFCRVVDNYGDAGISWRLARQLAGEFGYRVHFWIDLPKVLETLVPELKQKVSLGVDVSVRPWSENTRAITHVFEPSQLVITTFCAQFSLDWQIEIKQKNIQWIHLEYFSAEPWIDDFHAKVRVFPQSGAACTMFFSGLSPASGGVLRESFVQLPLQSNQHRWPISPKILFFTYEQTQRLPWAESLTEKYQAQCDVPVVDQEINHQRKNSPLVAIPFVPQSVFDQTLKQYDFLFVRGEDSVMRALFSGIPFVWHIYPQQDEIHLKKLQAFFEVISVHMEAKAKQALNQIWMAWNLNQPLTTEMLAYFSVFNHEWRIGLNLYLQNLFQQPDLASRLVRLVSLVGQVNQGKAE